MSGDMSFEQRLSALEIEVADLQRRVALAPNSRIGNTGETESSRIVGVRSATPIDRMIDILGPLLLAELERSDAEQDLATSESTATSAVIAAIERHRQQLGLVSVCGADCYQGSTRRFDVRLEVPEKRFAILEVKGAWKTYWLKKNNLAKFQSYLFAPLQGMRADNKSAARDLRKLATLCPPATTAFVGQLIVGSAIPADNLSADLDHYSRLAGLDAPPWRNYQSSWRNNHYPNYKYDVRLWLCPFERVAEWWEKNGSKFRE